MKRSNILRLMIGSQILGVMMLSCALSMENEAQMQTTTFNNLPKGPVQLISSFLSLSDFNRFVQTSKKIKGYIEPLKWERTIIFDLSENNNDLESIFDQIRGSSFSQKDDIQQVKQDQGTEDTEKKRKIAPEQEESANKKLKTEQQEIKDFKKIAHLKLTGVNEGNMRGIKALLNNYKDYIKDVSVVACSLGSLPNFGEFVTDFLKNTHITSIDLADVHISDDDAIAIAKMLETNKTIRSIDLSDNSISSKGAKAMANMFKTNKTITWIGLARNDISHDGVKEIAQGLKGNETITSIDLANNKISAEGAKAIVEALKKNTTLKSIELGDNEISDGGAKVIAEMLETNKTITSIGLSDNHISDSGAIAIAEALETNTTITLIDLSENNISSETEEKLEILAKTKGINIIL